MKKAVDKKSGILYAIKTVSKQNVKKSKELLTQLQTEFNFMSKIQHTNIVASFELVQDRSNYYHVMECCEHGNLF